MENRGALQAAGHRVDTLRVGHDLATNNTSNLSFLLDCKLFVSAIKAPTIYLVLLEVCGMKE